MIVPLLLALVTTIPAQPLIERARTDQRLNFDLVVANDGERTLMLQRIEATELTPDGTMIAQQRLDTNGDETTMSIATIPNRVLPPHGRLVIFNPFWRFAPDLALARIRYELTFADSLGERRESLEVAPKPYAGAPLRFPLRGEVFVHDGHDLYGHHRRLDVTGGMTTHFHITENFMRYAHDFVITDRSGRMFRTDGVEPADWFGYGANVLAPAGGVVKQARDGMKDNRKDGPPPFTEEAIMQDLTLFLGNHVVLAHDDGTYSVLAHLKEGSVRVRAGQRVRRGDLLGGMGMSGDAFLVHLHYQHQKGAGFEDGLPARFANVRVRTGAGWTKAFDGPVDSGDVVDAR